MLVEDTEKCQEESNENRISQCQKRSLVECIRSTGMWL